MMSLVERLMENNTFAAHYSLMEYKITWRPCYLGSQGKIENNE